MSATWSPGDTFQIAARGDRFDGTTGRIRRLWTGGDGREHAHVTHDDGTYTSWPTARLEKPTNSSGDAVTQPNPAPSDDTTPSLGIGDTVMLRDGTTGTISGVLRHVFRIAAPTGATWYVDRAEIVGRTEDPLARVLKAALDQEDLLQSNAADVTPLQLLDAADALHMAVVAYRAAVSR